MSKPILILILVASISLIAMAAHADPDQPAYGQDPNTEPPRSGVGNANSGNHEMHLVNNRKRWSYGVDTDAGETVGTQQSEEPICLPKTNLFVFWGRIFDLVVSR